MNLMTCVVVQFVLHLFEAICFGFDQFNDLLVNWIGLVFLDCF